MSECQPDSLLTVLVIAFLSLIGLYHYVRWTIRWTLDFIRILSR